MRSIPLCEPVLEGNETRYLAECVETGFVSSVGPFVDRFESAFAEYVGSKHAVACSSGTAALHVALRIAGAAPGELVPVSSFTFVASVNSIVYCGATPLMVDSEPLSWNMNTALLHEHVVRMADRGERLPKVIEVVHVLGMPAEMGPLLDLRDRYGIHIVEDAAEALGAVLADGRSVGAVGDLGCFSFNGNKMITAGGGGMIVTNDAELAHHARHLTTQARLPGTGYVHDEVGYNYRLTNIAAAVGLAQLEQLGGFLARKSEVASAYRAALDSGLGFTWPTPAAKSRSSYWLNAASVDLQDRDKLVTLLHSAGISARPVWRPCHTQPSLQAFPRIGGGVAEDLGARGICLPSSVSLRDEDIRVVVDRCSSGAGAPSRLL